MKYPEAISNKFKKHKNCDTFNYEKRGIWMEGKGLLGNAKCLPIFHFNSIDNPTGLFLLLYVALIESENGNRLM